jgi:uncharacterized protein YndB with AHSA1/START domain
VAARRFWHRATLEDVTIDPQGLVLEMTCVFDAPRELVFYALSDPAALAKWWGPSGFTTPEVQLDLQVGGRYRFGMQPPDADLFHLTGEFIEIDPSRRLAYTFRWEEPDPDDQETVVTLTLDAQAEGTSFHLSQGKFATADRLALHRSGWTDSLVKLRRFLGSGS